MSSSRFLAAAIVLALLLWNAFAIAQYGDQSPANWPAGGASGAWGGFQNGYGGGSPGFGYSPANMSLVVSQTQDVHGQVANLLDQLRRMQGTQVQITTPFHTLNDSYYERIGVDFDFSYKPGGNVIGLDAAGNPTPDGRIHFNQNSFGSALPPFGGYDPNADATFGFGIRGSRFSPSFRFALGQGSSRTHVMQAPTVVVQDGQTGFVSDTSQRPFVTSVIPVVGSGIPMMMPSPPISPVRMALARMEAEKRLGLQRARGGPAEDRGPMHRRALGDGRENLGAHRPLEEDRRVAAGEPPDMRDDAPLVLKSAPQVDADAERGEVASASSLRGRSSEAVERGEEIRARIEKARQYERAGKWEIAKIFYRQAAARADGDLKNELDQKIQSLGR